jgi:hypothetical protein
MKPCSHCEYTFHLLYVSKVRTENPKTKKPKPYSHYWNNPGPSSSRARSAWTPGPVTDVHPGRASIIPGRAHPGPDRPERRRENHLGPNSSRARSAWTPGPVTDIDKWRSPSLPHPPRRAPSGPVDGPVTVVVKLYKYDCEWMVGNTGYALEQAVVQPFTTY